MVRSLFLATVFTPHTLQRAQIMYIIIIHSPLYSPPFVNKSPPPTHPVLKGNGKCKFFLFLFLVPRFMSVTWGCSFWRQHNRLFGISLSESLPLQPRVVLISFSPGVDALSKMWVRRLPLRQHVVFPFQIVVSHYRWFSNLGPHAKSSATSSFAPSYGNTWNELTSSAFLSFSTLAAKTPHFTLVLYSLSTLCPKRLKVWRPLLFLRWAIPFTGSTGITRVSHWASLNSAHQPQMPTHSVCLRDAPFSATDASQNVCPIDAPYSATDAP